MPLQALADRDVDQNVLDGRAPSVGALFRSRVRATPDAPAYLYFAEGSSELTTLTWRQTHEVVEQWAAGLVSLGVALEDRVAIASTTRVEWILADLAVICAGGATTTVYPTTIAEDVAYILTDSGSGIVFAENEEQVAKLQHVRSEVPGRPAGHRPDRTGQRRRLGHHHRRARRARPRVAGRDARPRRLAHRPAHPRVPRRRHLHVRHDRAAQGRAPRPGQRRLRGRRHRRHRHLHRGRPPVPLAAAVARLRQDARRDRAPDRLPDRRRRPGRQDRREHGRHQADLHGRPAAHLREGARAHRPDVRRREGRQEEAHRLGAQGRRRDARRPGPR